MHENCWSRHRLEIDGRHSKHRGKEIEKQREREMAKSVQKSCVFFGIGLDYAKNKQKKKNHQIEIHAW